MIKKEAGAQLICDKQKFFNQYADSLYTILPSVCHDLKATGADEMVEREYLKPVADPKNEQGTLQRDKKTDQRTKYARMEEHVSVTLFILATLRSSGRNSLLKAYNIKISSYALGADFKLENEAYLSSLVGGDNEKFRAFCDEWFDYLFRNAELEFSQYDSKTWSLYRKEESRYVMNGYASRYPRWIQPEKNPSPGSDPIVMWERRGKTKFHQLLDKHKVNYGNQLRLLANEMFRVMLDKGVIIEDQESVGGGVRKNYALNLADVRLRLEEKPEADKESEKKDEFSIRVEEHTAQLSTYRGRLYQALFSQGKINVLSCSTTFEMGVDLGGLNCVFMANMPPATGITASAQGEPGDGRGAHRMCLLTWVPLRTTDITRSIPKGFSSGL